MSERPTTWWRRMLWPLRSRKVQVAVTTMIVAWAAEAGLNVKPEIVYTILGVGAALIGGIAHEDAASKAAGGGG